MNSAAPVLNPASTDDASPRHWMTEAIGRIEADFNRSADTHLIALSLSGYPGIDFYLKDESSHPTGSLKHRLARSLFLYALVNGRLRPGCTVIEASSGSTAVSEAYFARLLGLPFIAVIPAATSPEKIKAIEFQGGRCHLVANAAEIRTESERLEHETGGCFMDQFTYAERATDWRANNNIAESIFRQMTYEPHPVPEWIVCSAGTGGTSATLGRYARYRGYPTRILCVDPEHSVFYDYYSGARAGRADRRLRIAQGSRIEGIGRPQVEPSFVAGCIDAMAKVPDALSLAAMRHVGALLGRRVGGSTGSNFVGMLLAAQRMKREGRRGSVVGLLCDGGERYTHSYYDADWYAANAVERQQADVAIATAAAGLPLPSLPATERF